MEKFGVVFREQMFVGGGQILTSKTNVQDLPVNELKDSCFYHSKNYSIGINSRVRKLIG